MKRLIAAGLFALVLTFTAGAARAVPDEYDDSQSHPLRIAAYVAHPVGYAVEWLLFRPFHYLVSATPEVERIFGHRSGHEEVGSYRD